MSVLSLNTAVIWEKPLRENDQVCSRPGVPASAISSGNVTCFSISTGESAGAKALTWTWTLVMSGTASIGSLASDQTPHAAAARVDSSTSQRRRTEKARTRSIIAASILAQRFHQLRFERERIAHRDGLAGVKTRYDLHHAIVALAKDHLALLETFGHADEYDLAGAHALDRAGRRGERNRAFPDRDRGSDERARPPDAGRVGDLRHHPRRARLLVEDRADEHDLPLGLLGDSSYGLGY